MRSTAGPGVFPLHLLSRSISLRLLRRPIEIDPHRVAAAAAHRTGTLLLHTQRDWDGSGRSALLLDPVWTLHLRRGKDARWNGTPPCPLPELRDPLRVPLEWTRSWVGRDRSPLDAPVFAGLAGILSYDLGARLLGAAHPVPPPFDTEEMWLGAWDCALVFGGPCPPELVVADLSPLAPPRLPLPERAAEMEERLRALGTENPARAQVGRPPGSVEGVRLFDRDWHRRAVERIRHHLRAGDCYQINLTGFASCATSVDPWMAFLDQARANPVAFAAYARPEAHTTITCHSPERLLRLRGRLADTAPIKGTRAWTPDAAAELRASEKDRAEHVMIVDLLRNDLGRHARTGSVRVESLYEPLRLESLVHLVSRIGADYSPGGRRHALADLFPGGSITGAPKQRAVEIITALEAHARGPYTGSVGFVDRTGHADWNVAIRTAVWQNGQVHFGCGGGIVLDSDPDREYEEAALKARSFLESLRRGAAGPAHQGAAP